MQDTVYFIGRKNINGVDVVKVGKTKHGEDIRKRLRFLQVGCPEELVLIAKCTLFDEKYVHRKLKLDRIRGEWFKITFRTIFFINRYCKTDFGLTVGLNGIKTIEEVINIRKEQLKKNRIDRLEKEKILRQSPEHIEELKAVMNLIKIHKG